MKIFNLSNQNIPDDPPEVAEKVARKFLKKGYYLDFSIESLENEIDKIIKNEWQWTYKQKWRLQSELTAYFGETICRIYDAKWIGTYFKEHPRSASNYYCCKIRKNKFEFGPSHFFNFYFSNGSKNPNPFKIHLKNGFYSHKNNIGLFKILEKATEEQL